MAAQFAVRGSKLFRRNRPLNAAALVYAKIALVYPGVRLLLGVARMPKGTGFQSAWGMTALFESFGLYVLPLVLKLVIETVLVTAISFLSFLRNDFTPTSEGIRSIANRER